MPVKPGPVSGKEKGIHFIGQDRNGIQDIPRHGLCELNLNRVAATDNRARFRAQ
jgi:hypothetical protein